MTLEEIFMRGYHVQEGKHGIDAEKAVNALTQYEFLQALSESLDEYLMQDTDDEWSTDDDPDRECDSCGIMYGGHLSDCPEHD